MSELHELYQHGNTSKNNAEEKLTFWNDMEGILIVTKSITVHCRCRKA